MAVVSLDMSQATLDPAVIFLGVLVPFLIWGAAIVPVYRRLTIKSDGLPTEDEVRWAKSIDRRQFLVGLGAASANEEDQQDGHDLLGRLSGVRNTQTNQSNPVDHQINAKGNHRTRQDPSNPVK